MECNNSTYSLPLMVYRIGRPDEVQIVVANSELAIARGDFEEALKILGDVRSESPAYTKVQVPKNSERDQHYFIARACRPGEAIALYRPPHLHNTDSILPREGASGSVTNTYPARFLSLLRAANTFSRNYLVLGWNNICSGKRLKWACLGI